MVVAPDESVVPERMPGTTEAGNLSLRKLGKEARAGYYLQALTGHVPVTVREAFAVAPGLNAARVVVLRRGGINAYGSPHVEPILAARWTRDSLTGIRWDTVDATTITRDTATDLLMNTGRVGNLQALELAVRKTSPRWSPEWTSTSSSTVTSRTAGKRPATGVLKGRAQTADQHPPVRPRRSALTTY